MTVVEHLEELRHRIVICVIVVRSAAVAGWFLYPPFINLMRNPYCSYVNHLPIADQSAGRVPLGGQWPARPDAAAS